MDEVTNLAPVCTTTFNIASLNLAENDPSVIIGDTGTTVSAFPFERLKFEQGRQTRFAILTTKVVIVKRHYHESLGYVRCTGACCKYFDKAPGIVYLYPCCHYTDCDNKGKPLSDRIQVKMLQCNKDMYNYIVSIQEIKGNIDQFDFMGTQIPGSDKFPKTQLVEAGPALWRNNQRDADYIMDYLKQNSSRFLDSVGKVYTEDKLQELLGGGDSVTPETVTQDLDDIFRPV